MKLQQSNIPPISDISQSKSDSNHNIEAPLISSITYNNYQKMSVKNRERYEYGRTIMFFMWGLSIIIPVAICISYHHHIQALNADILQIKKDLLLAKLGNIDLQKKIIQLQNINITKIIQQKISQHILNTRNTSFLKQKALEMGEKVSEIQQQAVQTLEEIGHTIAGKVNQTSQYLSMKMEESKEYLDDLQREYKIEEKKKILEAILKQKVEEIQKNVGEAGQYLKDRASELKEDFINFIQTENKLKKLWSFIFN